MSRRHSIQRQLISDTLKRMDHPTAQDLLEEIRKEYPYLSMGTVYRNLNLLSTEGIVRKLSCQDSADRFEICLNPHYHIQCTSCGRYFDIDATYLRGDINKKIEEITGFLVKDSNVFFTGVCPLCQEGYLPLPARQSASYTQ